MCLGCGSGSGCALLCAAMPSASAPPEEKPQVLTFPPPYSANHFAVTFVHHRVCFSNAVFHAERVKRKPHITAGLAAELAHHRQVTLVRADHHAAAKEIEDRALGRLRMLSHDQAGKAVYRDRFIICLAVGWRKNATMPVLLFDFLSQCILRQGERLFRAGELYTPCAGWMQKCSCFSPPHFRAVMQSQLFFLCICTS